MNTNLSNRTQIGRIVTFLALAFGLSTIFYVLIITGGEGIDPWLLPLMLCPGVSAIITKLIFDRNLKGLGWKPGPAKWLGFAYLSITDSNLTGREFSRKVEPGKVKCS